MYHYKNITAGAPTTTICSSTPGVLHAITINKMTASAVIVAYDGVDATGIVIATITNPGALLKSQDTLIYDVATKRGLCIVTTTAQDITISYN